MAYRVFSQPEIAKAAVFEGMPNLLASINRNQLLKARKDQAEAKQKQELAKRVDALKYETPEGLFAQDIPGFYDWGTGLVNKERKTMLEGDGNTEANRQERQEFGRAIEKNKIGRAHV